MIIIKSRRISRNETDDTASEGPTELRERVRSVRCSTSLDGQDEAAARLSVSARIAMSCLVLITRIAGTARTDMPIKHSAMEFVFPILVPFQIG